MRETSSMQKNRRSDEISLVSRLVGRYFFHILGKVAVGLDMMARTRPSSFSAMKDCDSGRD
jgi:hypothetical protein